MSDDIIAALDLGSNTFRLMLAGRCGQIWAEKKVFQHIPRLSEHLEPGGAFAPEALKRAWEALDDFAVEVCKAGAGKVLAGATMAARLAADGPDFLAEINRRYGWEARILTGKEEAELTAAGVLAEISPLPSAAMIFDIGGRSTEFVTTCGRTIKQSRRLPMGVVKLTEAHLSAPANAAELKAVAEEVQAVMAKADFSDMTPNATLIGTAGTVTTVAALLMNLTEYRPELVNNACISGQKIDELLTVLASETIEERVNRHSLHPRRADAIVAGLVMVLEILNFFNRNDLVVSDNGLLEGIWLAAAGLTDFPD